MPERIIRESIWPIGKREIVLRVPADMSLQDIEDFEAYLGFYLAGLRKAAARTEAEGTLAAQGEPASPVNRGKP